MKSIQFYYFFVLALLSALPAIAQNKPGRSTVDFNKDWRFQLGSDSSAIDVQYDDSQWRKLNLPHDWSIEGMFSKDHLATNQGGALPGGTGWYRKSFTLPASWTARNVAIEFDGVHRNSSVWINGVFLGQWPYGYTAFRYDLTKHLKKFPAVNVIAVRVDNSQQPNSRWYTGSGIYRDVRLVTTGEIAFEPNGIFITTKISGEKNGERATVSISSLFRSSQMAKSNLVLIHTLHDRNGKLLATNRQTVNAGTSVSHHEASKAFVIARPQKWSVDHPYLYTVKSKLVSKEKVVDEVSTRIGLRDFYFDEKKGFFLNGEALPIRGVCMHHDLGALGAAFNKAAAIRQLRILKEMGCNAIRTAHNPPAAAFLDLCDEMGFLVMDEAFDMWQKRKNRFDYHLDFKAWHKKDLEAMVLRDRNHPSVFMWSIGNEIREQFDSSGIALTKELTAIVKSLDSTRPVTIALTETVPAKNFIYQSRALDVLGFNYKIYDYADIPNRFPGEKILASETVSALATRGVYDMPSDSSRVWPPDSKQPFTGGNSDMTVSAYDHAYAYWGVPHETALLAVNKHPFIAGTFVWSGFDFLGEPVPYPWPARSSYYGIVDLAGFPKDVYYLYQSEWTKKPVLHLFPHWNWKPGTEVDVWAYYNEADEVELFLNGQSLGTRRKAVDSLHVMWRVKYIPGVLTAISRRNGKAVLKKEIRTAGAPARLELVADRSVISADGRDLSFVTVRVLDRNGVAVPDADNAVSFEVRGAGTLAATDNGYQADLSPFSSSQRKMWKGLALAIIRSSEKAGTISVQATADGLKPATLTLTTSK